MSTIFSHLINNRTLTSFKPLEAERVLLPHKNYLFDLSHLGIIQVEGEKAVDFLQGQLTCDLHDLSEVQLKQGAQCNLKGRILALMDVVDWNGVKLILPNDLVNSTQNSLSKYAMLARVALKTNIQYRVFGFYLQNEADIKPFLPLDAAHATHSCLYPLGNNFYIFLTLEEEAQKIQALFKEADQLLGSLTWHTLRLAQLQLQIYPESRGLFLPHRLDLQQTSYLSFNKGCYKGQEIIARMHYKATLKHQMKIYEIKSTHQVYCGQKLLNKDTGAELGELVDYSLLEPEHYLIAVSILKEADQHVVLEGNDQVTQLYCAQPFI